ncbi:hypothetical protein BDZ94DRAFT_1258657 [Collybia nuda]|uniref:Uncharacterized protein n=1 Tax=Collybia nuda TaxID=64659 RepID=A0A9P6CIS5_9AGAR|nr:hypothetical protein BDZ94DRAFT_1258657 [Collybia nuda]
MSADEDVYEPNFIIYVDAVEGFKETKKWPNNILKRVVALTIKGPKHRSKAASSDPVIPGDPLWNWNTPMYEDFDTGDVVTLYLEDRLPLALKSPGVRIARTKSYTPETLWKLQSKQGLGKTIRLPLFSGSDNDSDATGALICQIREVYSVRRTRDLVRRASIANSPGTDTPGSRAPALAGH